MMRSSTCSNASTPHADVFSIPSGLCGIPPPPPMGVREMGPIPAVLAVPPPPPPVEELFVVAKDVAASNGQKEAKDGTSPLPPAEASMPAPSPLPTRIVEYDTELPLPRENDRSHCPIHLLHFPRSVASDD
mmetsp:Transcript_31777/g.55283  ORF Transcript_31777/g.55283 Transcript_31777/m.55283 type:complete len:131 (-) Transcript_31777:1297-1689(-)